VFGNDTGICYLLSSLSFFPETAYAMQKAPFAIPSDWGKDRDVHMNGRDMSLDRSYVAPGNMKMLNTETRIPL